MRLPLLRRSYARVLPCLSFPLPPLPRPGKDRVRVGWREISVGEDEENEHDHICY